MSRWVWLGITAAFCVTLFLLSGFLVLLYGFWPPSTSPTVSRPGLPWATLPTPTISRPEWTTFTYPKQINDLTLTNSLLWLATSGGVVGWDVTTNTQATWRVEHGLAANHITAVAHTPDGRLWFGTADGGLSIFDGTTWATVNQTSGLPHNQVRDVVVDQQGGVWVATAGGLAHFADGNWQSYTTTSTLFALPSNDVQTLLVVQDELWFGTAAGLGRYQADGRFVQYNQSNGLPSAVVRHLVLAPDGSVLVATAGGVAQFMGQTWHTLTQADGLLLNDVHTVTMTADGVLWVGYGPAGRGLTQLRLEDGHLKARHLYFFDGLLSDTITHLWATPAGLWIGTTEGANFLNPAGEFSAYVPVATLPHPTITDLEWADNTLWLASPAGVSQLTEDDRWQTLGMVGGLASEPPTQLAVDPYGLLWVAYRTVGPGLSYLNPDTGQWVNRPCASWRIPADYARARYAGVQTLTLTADGSAWVGMHDGLFYAQREQNQFVCQLVPEVAGSATVSTQLASAGSAYVLAGGQVWQGQAGQLTAAEFALTQTVQSLAVVPEGSVWLVSGGELILQSAYNQKRIPLPAGVGQVQELLLLGSEVWLATSAGVWVVESGRWRTLTPAEGLPSVQVWRVRYTGLGEWWFGTAGGLARYRP